MKLSIIVPYDGYPHYLVDCLASIDEQKIDDYETLLLVNENHEEINELIEQYKNKIHLNVIVCGEVSSVATKRNIGLNEAKGEYIYFLDCDDYLLKRFTFSIN